MIIDNLSLDCTIETVLKFIYLNRMSINCSYYGMQDTIKISYNMKNFIAHRKIYEGAELNSYIVFKFYDKTDGAGYKHYEPVRRIVHDMNIIFSPENTQFIELDPTIHKFKVHKICHKKKLNGELATAGD